MPNASLLARNQIDNARWDGFVEHSPEQTIYATSGYLDCVCPGWHAIVVEENGVWQAILPLNLSRKFFITYSLRPPFVQYLGVFFRPDNFPKHRELHWKKNCINAIGAVLSKSVRFFNHNFSPRFQYFVPWHWQNFDIRPFQSYIILFDKNIDAIFKNFSPSLARNIRRAEANGLELVRSKNEKWLTETMVRQNIISSKQGEIFGTLWQYLADKGLGFLLFLKEPKTQKICCGGAFVVDKNKVIYLASAIEPAAKKSGAGSYLTWRAIQMAYQMKGIRLFDFEGSMLENVERYNRSFGAVPVVFFNIQRDSLPLAASLALRFRRAVFPKRA